MLPSENLNCSSTASQVGTSVTEFGQGNRKFGWQNLGDFPLWDESIGVPLPNMRRYLVPTVGYLVHGIPSEPGTRWTRARAMILYSLVLSRNMDFQRWQDESPYLLLEES